MYLKVLLAVLGSCLLVAVLFGVATAGLLFFIKLESDARVEFNSGDRLCNSDSLVIEFSLNNLAKESISASKASISMGKGED